MEPEVVEVLLKHVPVKRDVKLRYLHDVPEPPADGVVAVTVVVERAGGPEEYRDRVEHQDVTEHVVQDVEDLSEI